jgi:hypothetical protein
VSRTLTGCHRYSPKQAKVAKLAKRTATPTAAAPLVLLAGAAGTRTAPPEFGSRCVDSPRLPTEPFLNVYRTPPLQCLQQVGRLVPRQHQRPILGLQKSLLYRWSNSRAANLLVMRFVTAKLNAATHRLRNRIRRMGASRIARSKMTAVMITKLA